MNDEYLVTICEENGILTKTIRSDWDFFSYLVAH